MPRRITLKDIAQKAGVSTMAVSLALRDKPDISKSTKEHITKIAEELGYVPDPALRALAHYRVHKKIIC